MIERINLIEKKRLQMTYGLCFMLLGMSLMICLLFYGGLVLREYRNRGEVARLRTSLQSLKEERESLLSHEKEIQGFSAYTEIQKRMQQSISWSFILNTIAQTLPPNVWLTSLKSSNQENNTDKTLILNGQAKNPQGLTVFLSGLEASPYFDNVHLTTSKEDASKSFQFSAACVIKKGDFQ